MSEANADEVRPDARQTQELLEHRLAFEKLISAISTNFINVAAADVDREIAAALESVGRFVGADRAYIYMLSDDGETATLTHEWNADPNARARRRRERSDVGVSLDGRAAHRRCSRSSISIDDLPPEAAAEREAFKRAGNHSIVVVPMIYNREFLGALGVASAVPRKWSDEAVSLLRISGEIFVNAIQRHRAEAALRGSEQRHRAAVRAQPGRRLSQHHRRPHPRLQRRHGPHPRLLLARGADAAVRAELYQDPAQRDDFIAELRRERMMTSHEISLRRKDGRPVWLIESVHLLDGDPEILEGTVIDITDRKLAENALRESEERYRLLVERMREGLVQADNDGVLQFVNDRFCEMVGYTREELVGAQGDLLLAYPEDIALMREKTRLRMRHIADQYEVRVRRKDGTVVWLEIGGAPVVDAAGNVVGSIGVHNDVTERRMAEEALRESEARYRLMAENSTDMISRTSNKGIILYASDACRRLLGYEPSELVGRSFYDFIFEVDREEVRYLSVADPRVGTDDVRLPRREKGRLAGVVRDDQPQRARRAHRQRSARSSASRATSPSASGSRSRSSIRPITMR